MSDICDQSAVALRQAIGRRALSPVEILDSCIARIEAVNPAVNAIVATDFERARRQAQAAEQAVMAGEELGLLHGLPLGIKDLSETAGLRTTFASELYRDHVPAQDGTMVAALRAAGGIVAAKTNTPEFGAGANSINSVYGFTANPFDPSRICGGSSGGSAVTLATGMLPLASGSDLGGSLRTPSAFCGVLGFRPTPGLIASGSRLLGWSPLAVEGPMARSVPDLCLMAAAMVGGHPNDPLSRVSDPNDFVDPAPADLGDLKVAYSEDLGFVPIDPEIRRIFQERMALIAELFGQFQAADPGVEPADRMFEVLRAVEFLSDFDKALDETPEKFGPNVTANVRLGRTFSAQDVAEAAAAHTRYHRRFGAFMAEHEILICPAASLPPFHKEQLYPTEVAGHKMRTYIQWVAISYGITLSGHPVVCLPCGLDHQGTPFGIQVVGRYGQDSRLLAIARALETALAEIDACRRPLPDLAALAKHPPPVSSALENPPELTGWG